LGPNPTSAADSASSQVPLFPHDPTCYELISAANRFIVLGEDATIEELKRTWRVAAIDSSTAEQISWLCRLLYTPKDRKTLRSPYFGSPAISYGIGNLKDEDWPYFPLIKSQGIFFLVPANYTLAGLAEDPIAYLTYTRKEGLFRSTPLKVPTEKEASQALDAYFSSDVWKELKWSDSPFYPDREGLIEYLKAQTSRVATKASGPIRVRTKQDFSAAPPRANPGTFPARPHPPGHFYQTQMPGTDRFPGDNSRDRVRACTQESAGLVGNRPTPTGQ
jgi:hypothetical protein